MSGESAGRGGASWAATRRRFLATAGAAGAVAVASCSGQLWDVGGSESGDAPTGDADGATTADVVGATTGDRSGDSVVNVLAWEGYGTDPLVNEFESEHDATVNVTPTSSDSEAFDLLTSGGTERFDLLTLTNAWAQRHAKAGTIEELDPDDYPEMEHFLERFGWPFEPFVHDDRMFALPTRWGWDTLAVNTEAVPEADSRSYEVLWTGGPDGEYEGELGVVDWPTWNVPKIALSLGHPPFEQNEDQLREIEDRLVEVFSNMRALYTGTSAVRRAFLREDIVMAPVGTYAMSTLRAAGNDWVDVVVPEQGGMQWTEGLCIVRDPNDRELAVQFQRKVVSETGQFDVSWRPSAKSPPVNTASFDRFSEDQQRALMCSDEGFDAAADISRRTTPYRFSPIADTWTDLWNEAKTRADI